MSRIFVYGADPFRDSPSSSVLLKELLNAGFKPAEIKYVNNKEDIPDDSYVICFGLKPTQELTGCNELMSELHGTLCSMDSKPHVLVFPTYSPGYLFHNPKEIGTFKAELELFRCIIRIDQGKAI